MKLNIYVPDDLWRRAADLRPDLNPSQVVQAALSHGVATGTSPIADARPPGADGALKRAADRLMDQARAEFAEGYAAGLRIGDGISWAQLEKFAVVYHFDLKRWLEPWANYVSGVHRFGEAEMREMEKEAFAGTQYDHERRPPDELQRAADEHDRMIELLKAEVADLVDDFVSQHRSWAWVQGCQTALRDLWERVTSPVGEGIQVAHKGGRPIS
ncbi:MAG: hypothetical protein M0Z47_04115 [Actinomycetota bacterium]|nr:hypothetical protein [Actinomycetota bacterium]